MKTPLRLAGAAAVAVAWMSLKSLPAQETDAPPVPLEAAVMMTDYVAKRNQALAEFNRIYLARFKALEAKYKEEKNAAAARALRNKIIQLQKEIERLEAVTEGGFVLLEANYGSDEKNVECLDLLLGQVRDDRLRIIVKPAAIGLDADPHYGVRKTLTIKYLWNDKVRTATARDGQLVELPEAADGD